MRKQLLITILACAIGIFGINSAFADILYEKNLNFFDNTGLVDRDRQVFSDGDDIVITEDQNFGNLNNYHNDYMKESSFFNENRNPYYKSADEYQNDYDYFNDDNKYRNNFNDYRDQYKLQVKIYLENRPNYVPDLKVTAADKRIIVDGEKEFGNNKAVLPFYFDDYEFEEGEKIKVCISKYESDDGKKICKKVKKKGLEQSIVFNIY